MSFEKPHGPPRQGDRGPEVIAVAVVGMTLTGIALILRFWSRLQAKPHYWWWDDLFILLTAVFSYAFLALNIHWTTLGLGRHIESVPLSAVLPSIYISHATIVIYAVNIWLIKMSALLFYARVFQPDGKFIYSLWIVGGVVTSWMVCTAVVPWFNCSPVSKGLSPSIPGVCFNRITWYRVSSFMNFFFDLVILLLPIPRVWKLNMTRKQRLFLSLVFLIGYASAFLSLARFIIIIMDPRVMSTQPSADPYWRSIPMLLLSMLEAPLAIVAICGPVVGRLIARAWNQRHFSFIRIRSIFSNNARSHGFESSGSHDTDYPVTEDDKSTPREMEQGRFGSKLVLTKTASED